MIVVVDLLSRGRDATPFLSSAGNLLIATGAVIGSVLGRRAHDRLDERRLGVATTGLAALLLIVGLMVVVSPPGALLGGLFAFLPPIVIGTVRRIAAVRLRGVTPRAKGRLGDWKTSPHDIGGWADWTDSNRVAADRRTVHRTRRVVSNHVLPAWVRPFGRDHRWSGCRVEDALSIRGSSNGGSSRRTCHSLDDRRLAGRTFRLWR